ncbi:MAG: bifunctional adenosylcobinamide kinase/adenosylcobinamide-phosphate guanylyltransferase [Selenomonadaceae bacterium]|nr:bifunctional adenosylcobinamide kinase/adenosylcobinamide-phosphate guanylyltransferase [Selenomonadaceae bacterium]
MGKIVLVTGGSRSGKSTYAEEYVAKLYKCGEKVGYIATSQIFDDEMKFRVRLHQERRPAEWTTYEAPFDAHLALKQAAADGCTAVLFDCVTIYMSNLLCSLESIDDSDENYALANEKISALIEAARSKEGTTVFVTNEVGSGIVPENKLSREYRDIAGLANQWLAAAADEAYFVVCGIPVNLKELSSK